MGGLGNENSAVRHTGLYYTLINGVQGHAAAVSYEVH